MMSMSDLAAAYRWLDDQGAAFGAPGLEPRWTSSEKDAVWTAYSASSRVWFTALARHPRTRSTTRRSTVRRRATWSCCSPTARPSATKRSATSTTTLHYIHPDAPAVRVTASDPDGRYTVTKEFISDPHHPAVLMHVKVTGDEAILSRLKCYALLAPHLKAAARATRRARSRSRASDVCWRGRATSRWRWARAADSPARPAGLSARATAIRTCATT